MIGDDVERQRTPEEEGQGGKDENRKIETYFSEMKIRF